MNINQKLNQAAVDYVATQTQRNTNPMLSMPQANAMHTHC